MTLRVLVRRRGFRPAAMRGGPRRRRGLAARPFPAACRGGKDLGLVHLVPSAAFPTTTARRRLKADTLYDVASLTKVVARHDGHDPRRRGKSTCASRRPPSSPASAGAKEKVTVETSDPPSGLAAGRRSTRKSAARRSSPEGRLDGPRLRAGDEVGLHDLGFFLLGEVLERVAASRSTRSSRARVYEPLG